MLFTWRTRLPLNEIVSTRNLSGQHSTPSPMSSTTSSAASSRIILEIRIEAFTGGTISSDSRNLLHQYERNYRNICIICSENFPWNLTNSRRKIASSFKVILSLSKMFLEGSCSVKLLLYFKRHYLGYIAYLVGETVNNLHLQQQ
jgi:hypothetical protein